MLLVVPTTSLIYALFHLLVEDPKLNVSVVSGIISLAISALNVTLSVSASPIIIFPFAVILPVAVILPCTFVLPIISTVPVPFGTNSILALDSLVAVSYTHLTLPTTPYV